ncbi:MAG: hypothetical protein HFF42_08405 [Lawsonibacter sp.]|nr:hypothetical protein [Lawsonibacter sp.]
MGTDTSSRSNDDFCQNCTRTNYTITQNFLQELSFVTLSDSLDWKDLYTFVPISQIILSGEYTIDHTGRQCPA